MNDGKNTIDLVKRGVDPSRDFKIDCEDCKNYWLIKGNKQQHVLNAYCMGNHNKTLFDQEIKTKLSQKCK